MLTAERLASIDADIETFRQCEHWVHMAMDLRAALFHQQPTADDSELQGELDVLRRFREQDRSKLFYLEEQAARIEVSLSNEGLDAVTWGSIADRVELLSGKQLVNQLTAERAKVAELQHALETANAAAASHEPVGFAYQSTGDIPRQSTGINLVTVSATPEGTRRRVYLGPAEPLEVTP